MRCGIGIISTDTYTIGIGTFLPILIQYFLVRPIPIPQKISMFSDTDSGPPSLNFYAKILWQVNSRFILVKQFHKIEIFATNYWMVKFVAHDWMARKFSTSKKLGEAEGYDIVQHSEVELFRLVARRITSAYVLFWWETFLWSWMDILAWYFTVPAVYRYGMCFKNMDNTL